MNIIIAQLYDSLFDLPSDYFEREEVKDNHAKVIKTMRDLMDALPDDKQSLAREYENAVLDSLYDEFIETFRQGIKIGMDLYQELEE